MAVLCMQNLQAQGQFWPGTAGPSEGYLPRLRTAAPTPAVLALDAFEVKLGV